MVSSALLSRLVDAHCHPTDSGPVSDAEMQALPITVCAMSSNHHDQVLVRDLATRFPAKVIPCFGYHPWFVHTISLDSSTPKELHYRQLLLDPNPSSALEAAFSSLLSTLPDPVPLQEALNTLRANLLSFPHAFLGEVGLDRAFRLPSPLPQQDSRRKLSPFSTPLAHQMAILEPQLNLAVELQRNVSLHSVKSGMATVELLVRMKQKWSERWWKIGVDMHSCGLSVETWLDIERNFTNVYLSLSTVINLRHPSHRALLTVCKPTRILVESDFNDIAYCAERTLDMVKIVADVKGWHVEEDVWNEDAQSESTFDGTHGRDWGAIRRLEANWRAFARGEHPPSTSGKTIKPKPRRG